MSKMNIPDDAIYTGPPKEGQRCRACQSPLHTDLRGTLYCKPCGWRMDRRTYERAVLGLK